MQNSKIHSQKTASSINCFTVNETQSTNDTTNNSTTTTTSTSTSRKMPRRTTEWIKRFCSFDRNKLFCMVDTDYIADPFNLIGLDEKVPYYQTALSIILDNVKESFLDDDDDDDDDENGNEIRINTAAEMLYGLIHARFILTGIGLQRMLVKFQNKQFGTCIRYYCQSSPMLPIGLHDQPKLAAVRLYCPRCINLYVPHFSTKCFNLDGAYFGTSFPQMFLMTFPNHQPPFPTESYVPRLYGFQIHPDAYKAQAAASDEALKSRLFGYWANGKFNNETNNTVIQTRNEKRKLNLNGEFGKESISNTTSTTAATKNISSSNDRKHVG